MYRGELSSDFLPHVYVVFEGLIGVLPDTKTKTLEALARKRKKWEQAVEYYQLSFKTKQGIRDLHRKKDNFKVDVITFLDPGMVEPIHSKLDSRNMFISNVHYFTVESLLDELTYDTSIIRILDPDPKHALTYGSKGRIVTSEQLDFMSII